MKMLVAASYGPEVDLSKTVAFTDGSQSIMFTEMSRGQVEELHAYAWAMFRKYPPGQAGGTVASEVLGALEDTFPSIVEDLEGSQC